MLYLNKGIININVINVLLEWPNIEMAYKMLYQNIMLECRNMTLFKINAVYKIRNRPKWCEDAMDICLILG